MKLTTANKLVLVLSSGLIIIIIGLYMGWFGFPSIMNSRIAKFKRLDNNESLQMFIKLPAPMDFKVFLYNVSNPDEVLHGALPVLQEVGPYVYEEYITNEILESDNSNTMKYMKHANFIFNQNKSEGRKESDLVTVINLPLLAIALFLEKNMPLGLDVLEEAIPFLFPAKNKLVLTDTVSNLFFDGIPIRCIEDTELFCQALKSKPLDSLKYDESTNSFRFGFFTHKNGSTGPYEIDKGLNDVRNVGQILSYKGDSVLNTWVPNSTCDAIRGNDAILMGPFLPADQPVYIFESDICLSCVAEYAGETEYLGMPVSKFVGSRLNFAEENSNCRCPREDFSDPSSLPDCLSPGLIDLTPCQGAPVLASQPHFYQGDDELRFSELMNPVPNRHETFTIIDRLTGVPLIGQKRVQLNILMKPIEDITFLENVTTLVFPALWLEEGVELDAEVLEPLIKLHRILGVLQIAKWVLVGVGGALIATGIGYYLYNRKGNFNRKDAESPPNNVLFSKVTRREGYNVYTTNPSSVSSKQLPSSNLQGRERYNNNIIDGDNYVMTLSSKLYPDGFSENNLQKNSSAYPS